jgi:GT2 family glycosyltransferase
MVPPADMTGPRASLLLPNYNNDRVLDVVLDRLATNTTYPDVEVVIVDDGSTDRSPEILRRWRDSGAFAGDVRLIEKPNGGVTDSLNTALEAADGELCVQLDSDASIETPGWLETMVDLMLLDDRVGAVGPKIVMDSGLLHACGIDIVGPAGVHDRPSRPLEPIGRRRWHHRVERVSEGYGGDIEHRVNEVDGLLGCCMLYRREDALAAGGYDMGYTPLWFDDIDLCMSIRRLGRKVFYLPDVRVVHHLLGRQPPRLARERYRPARVASVLARRAVRRLPGGAPARVERRFGVDLDGHFTREQLARCQHHYRYWRDKWGWDFNNPDMAEVERRWGDTEICWATDPERRAAGEEIARAYERSRAAAG